MARSKRRVRGLAELKRNCAAVGRRVDRAIEVGVKAGAEAVAGEARRLVAVAEGELRDSIHVESEAGRKDASVVADAFHAAFVELGTSKMPARPYLGPAAAGQAPVVRSLVARAVKFAIEKTKARR